MGHTIKWYENEKNVMMIIIGCKHDNSKIYTKRQITHMLDDKIHKMGWKYTYM